MLDNDGFRPNVGIILCNSLGQVFWARRLGGKNSWQFPQGGISKNESPTDAMYRELHEEVGLHPEDVTLLAQTNNWLRYRLPNQYKRTKDNKTCIGQKQKWFLLQLDCDESNIDLNADTTPEFDQWQWVSYWYPVNQVIYFKQAVYRRALLQLARALPKPA